MLVYKDAVVVAVYAKDIKREVGYCRIHGLTCEPAAFAHEGSAHGPSGGYISHVQGIDELTLGAAAAMRNQIDLKKAWSSVVPIRKGSDRNLMLEECPWFSGGSAFDAVFLALRQKESIDSRCAHPEKEDVVVLT